MPRCQNGHDSSLALKCSVCGAEIQFAGAIADLLSIPKVSAAYEDLFLLYVGFPRTKIAKAFAASVVIADSEGETEDTFSAARMQGASWFDLCSRDRDRLSRWLRIVGMERASYRIILADTTDPLSVLAISSIPQGPGTVVFAIVADQDSTPLEQNASYSAVSAAMKKGFPVVAATDTFVDDLSFFVEGEGFVTREDALAHVVSMLCTAVAGLFDSLQKDARLGVLMHSFSAILAATDRVYKSVGDAFIAQQFRSSLEIGSQEIQTVYLASFASDEYQNEIERGFRQYRNKLLKGAVNADSGQHPRSGSKTLYDLVLLYGLKEAAVLNPLAEGYQTVLSRIPHLGVESIPA